MPEAFSGQSNFKDWLLQFKTCQELNKWTDKQACQFLAVKLKGSALQVFADLDSTQRGSLSGVFKALADRFDPERDTGVYWSQLKGRIRKKGETLADLAGYIGRMVTKVYPDVAGSVRDVIAVQHFIDALENRDIQKQLRRLKPENLNKALRLAIDEESYVYLEKQGPRASSLIETEESDKDKSDGAKKGNELKGLSDRLLRLDFQTSG